MAGIGRAPGGAAFENDVSVRLFGGVELCGPGGSTTLSGTKQRALAARLAIDASHAVSIDQLIDSVWGAESPPTVKSSLQVHISQIRRALSDVGVMDAIATRPGGYALEIDPLAIDVHRFEQLTSLARVAHDAADHQQSLDTAHAALDLWRGPPAAGAGDLPFVSALTTSLEGTLFDLIPLAASSSIATGRSVELVAVVETLVSDHPYNEPLWASLARLLYAQGRQADALERLATVRRSLLEELGLDPTPAVVDLERQILDHSPALAPAARPAPRPVVDSAGSNLPLLRPLIGRDSLIADVVGKLADSRVVTLTGPGGVGKTSIAVHAAVAYGAKCRDGACFVDLTAIAPGEDPLATTVGALGMVTSSKGASLDDVLQLLGTRRQLLVLDNCEHVLEPSAAIVAAVTADSDVRVLATSREPLGVVDEIVIDIPPLSPAEGAELFVRRAQSVYSGFSPDPHEVADVNRIVELVDGLPLALELASPLVRFLSPAQIADELASGTAAGAGDRHRGGRHASMNEAVAWSYELLDEPGRALFERFSVFEGGTDLDGVLDVCGDASDGRLGRDQVLDHLGGLVSRSLVTVERTPSGIRYRMLVPVQAFARQVLERSAEADHMHRRHVAHVIAWLTQNAKTLESAEPLSGLVAFDHAAGNIRAAYGWCRRHGEDLLAAEIVGSISTIAFHHLTAIPELRSWVSESLRVTDARPGLRMRILLAASISLDQPPEQSIEQADAAIELAGRADDIDSVVLGRIALGHPIGESDNVAAIAALEETLEIAGSGAKPVLEGMILDYLCAHLFRAERFRDAELLLDRHCAFGTRSFGLYEPQVLYQRGRVAIESNDLDAAEDWFKATESSAHRTGSVCGRAYAMMGFAQVALHRGEIDESVSRFQESLELAQLVEPSEAWVDRLFLVVAAFRAGRTDIVSDQFEAIPDSARPIVRATRCFVSGCLAAMNGHRRIARQQFNAAFEQFLSMRNQLLAILVLNEWARIDDPTLVEVPGGLRSRIRSGEFSLEEAYDRLKSLE